MIIYTFFLKSSKYFVIQIRNCTKEIFFRNAWLLWRRPGTPSISSALNAASSLAKRASTSETASLIAARIILTCSLLSAAAVIAPLWRITYLHSTANGIQIVSSAGWVTRSHSWSILYHKVLFSAQILRELVGVSLLSSCVA